MWSRTRIYCAKNFFGDSIALRVFQKDGESGLVSLMTNMTMTTIEPNATMSPTQDVLQLDAVASQELMDGLWDCGIRPSNGTGSTGQLQAQQEHIKDLRNVIENLFSGKALNQMRLEHGINPLMDSRREEVKQR